MKHTRALVTLTLGDNFRQTWQEHCRRNWEQYAMRHQADVICLDEPLDASPRAAGRSSSWQKLLVLGQPQVQEYDQVVWLDADVLLHPQADWIGATVPPHLVGAADEFGYPTPELHHRALRQLYKLWGAHGAPFETNLTAQELYRVGGFEREFPNAIQAGMLVLTPNHREILEYVYFHYTQSTLKGLSNETRPLSYELLSAGLVHWMEPHWHARWLIEKQLRYPFLFSEPHHPLLEQCATRALAENCMLHFAGSPHELSAVNLNAPELTRIPQPHVYTITNPQATPRCETPVALILFNRPQTTMRVMQAIRAARPHKLFLIADGPRPDHPSDAVQCADARAIALTIDWECEVVTNFAETNLGLKQRVESGLDWLFSQVERAIILEDDCLPQPTFFTFCDELLERFADDPRIMTISGCDYKFGLTGDANSYTFSRYSLIWGWATWRRAWQTNDPEMSGFKEAMEHERLETMLGSARAARYWDYFLNEQFILRDSWDGAWMWNIWQREGLNIHPNVNLVENIGFGAQATHTQDGTSTMSELLSEPMPFPLQHPIHISRDERGDDLIEEIAFSGTVRQLWERVRQNRVARKQVRAAA